MLDVRRFSHEQFFFVPYGQGVICNALKAYLESIVFPIPNTNEAIPGKSVNIYDIIIGRESEKKDVISIKIVFKGDWRPNNLEFELVENHLNELLVNWYKITDYRYNGIEYIGTAKLMMELGDFLRMGGYTLVK